MGASPFRVSTGLLLGNDFFNPLALSVLGGRRFDDNGFTNDLGGWLALERGADRFSLDGLHRMITERGGLRRTDEVDVGGRWARTFTFGGTRLRTETGAALALSGPLGGEKLQDSIHSIIRGRRLDGTGIGQLQDLLPDRTRAGLVLSASLTLEHDLTHWLTVGCTGRGAVALGATGVSSAAATMFAGVTVPLLARVAVDARASVSANVLATADPTLTLRGGYATGAAFVSTELSAGVSVRPVRVGFSLRTNEGGSGANLGVLSLGFNF